MNCHDCHLAGTGLRCELADRPALCAARRAFPHEVQRALGVPAACRLGAESPAGGFVRRERPWPAEWTGRRRPDDPAAFPSDRDAPPGVVRVGIVTPGLLRGGAEQWMLSLLDHVDRARVHWAGVAVRYEQVDPGMRDEFRRRAPVAVGEAAVDALYRRVDVAVVWGVASWDQRMPARPRTPRIVLVSHGVGPWTGRVFGTPDQADAIVAVARAAVGPIPAPHDARAAVIPNCYEPNRIAPQMRRAELREAWGVAPGETVVGFLGRLSDEKNPDALVALAAADPRVRGVFVGSGGAEARLRRQAAAAGVDGRVVFHGPVEAPGAVLEAFDAMLLPSHEEACSVALLEAWAAGVPVLATPVGIVPERPGLVRLLPRDPSGPAIAAALAEDLADRDGTTARAARGIVVACEEYSPERFGRAWTELLAAEGRLQASLRAWCAEAEDSWRRPGGCGCR